MKTLHLISHDWRGIIRVGFVNVLKDKDLIATTYGLTPGSKVIPDKMGGLMEDMEPNLPRVMLFQEDHVFELNSNYHTYSDISRFVNGEYVNPNMRQDIVLI